MRVPRCIVAIAFLIVSSFTLAQAKLEKIGPLTDTSVHAAVRAALDPAGARLVRSDGSVLCEVWLRKSLPAGKVTAAKGAAYSELYESAFVGVISFPNGGKDFRGQAIKPGSYTMRYELLPEDGNHLGVAPTRDFVLLAPVSADTSPNAQFDLAQLVTLSSEAAGTNHPAVFVLLSPGPVEIPRTYQNPDGFQVFADTLKTDGGKTLPIALVVKGQAEQ